MSGEHAETWAVIVAAGEGRRLDGGRPKAFVGFRGRVLLAASIDLLEAHPAVDGIVLVVPAGWEEPASLLADELVAGKVSAAVAGGASRAESVAAGLAQVPERAAVVVVHDAARPLAGPDLVTRVLAGLADADGVVPALPVADTVKAVSGDVVAETLDRSRLVAVQTPQAFVADRLRRAYAVSPQRLRAATDCASLLEASGMTVRTVPGERANIKITDAHDLQLAESAR